MNIWLGRCKYKLYKKTCFCRLLFCPTLVLNVIWHTVRKGYEYIRITSRVEVQFSHSKIDPNFYSNFQFLKCLLKVKKISWILLKLLSFSDYQIRRTTRSDVFLNFSQCVPDFCWLVIHLLLFKRYEKRSKYIFDQRSKLCFCLKCQIWNSNLKWILEYVVGLVGKKNLWCHMLTYKHRDKNTWHDNT